MPAIYLMRKKNSSLASGYKIMGLSFDFQNRSQNWWSWWLFHWVNWSVFSFTQRVNWNQMFSALRHDEMNWLDFTFCWARNWARKSGIDWLTHWWSRIPRLSRQTLTLKSSQYAWCGLFVIFISHSLQLYSLWWWLIVRTYFLSLLSLSFNCSPLSSLVVASAAHLPS